VTTLDAIGDHFIERAPHTEELKLAHEVENLGAFHQPALRKLS
jgi:hypothetical protein